MEAELIDGVALERADNLIKVLFASGEWPTAALKHLRVDQEAFKNYITNFAGLIREWYPDIDPRHDAAITTMFTHMFFAGVAAGQGSGYSEDSGLRT